MQYKIYLCKSPSYWVKASHSLLGEHQFKGSYHYISVSDHPSPGYLLILIELWRDFPQSYKCTNYHYPGKLYTYCLQARPIVTLPPSPFVSLAVPGSGATLWDNSNIVESFAGVTSSLTFSFASLAYKQFSWTLTTISIVLISGWTKALLHVRNARHYTSFTCPVRNIFAIL